MRAMWSTDNGTMALNLFGWVIVFNRHDEWQGWGISEGRFLRVGYLILSAVAPARPPRIVLWAYRVRRRIRRARLALTPWPVWVAFSGHCCDTGPMTWAHHYRWGWQAWQATTWDALDGVSDGGTDYSLVTRAEHDDIREANREPRLGWDDQARERQAEEDERWERHLAGGDTFFDTQTPTPDRDDGRPVIGEPVDGVQIAGQEDRDGKVVGVINPAPGSKGSGYDTQVEWMDTGERSWHDASDLYFPPEGDGDAGLTRALDPMALGPDLDNLRPCLACGEDEMQPLIDQDESVYCGGCGEVLSS